MNNWWLIQNPKARIGVACGAGLAYGNAIGRMLTENFGIAAGLVGGLAATVVLAFGFYQHLDTCAKSKSPAENQGH